MPPRKEKGLFGDAKWDYDEVAEQREQTLEELDPPGFAPAIAQRPTSQSFAPPIFQQEQQNSLDIEPVDEDVMPPDKEAVTALLVRTEALLNQALKVPPDEDGTLREYPDKILVLEKRLKLAQSASDMLAVSIELREMEVAFKWDVLDNVTRITEKQQRAKNFRTLRLIPAIIVLYSILMVVILLQSDANYVLPLFQIPLSVIGAGLVGGVTAQYYRYRSVTPSRLTDNDIVWFFTKPPIAVLMAGLAFGIIQAGFFVFQGEAASNLTLWPIWIIAALVGFSDWFFDTFIVQAVGRITGEEDEAIVTELREAQMLSEQEAQAAQLRQLATGGQQEAVRRLLQGNARITATTVSLAPGTEEAEPDAALVPGTEDIVDALPEDPVVINPMPEDSANPTVNNPNVTG